MSIKYVHFYLMHTETIYWNFYVRFYNLLKLKIQEICAQSKVQAYLQYFAIGSLTKQLSQNSYSYFQCF